MLWYRADRPAFRADTAKKLAGTCARVRAATPERRDDAMEAAGEPEGAYLRGVCASCEWLAGLITVRGPDGRPASHFGCSPPTGNVGTAVGTDTRQSGATRVENSRTEVTRRRLPMAESTAYRSPGTRPSPGTGDLSARAGPQLDVRSRPEPPSPLTLGRRDCCGPTLGTATIDDLDSRCRRADGGRAHVDRGNPRLLAPPRRVREAAGDPTADDRLLRSPTHRAGFLPGFSTSSPRGQIPRTARSKRFPGTAFLTTSPCTG